MENFDLHGCKPKKVSALWHNQNTELLQRNDITELFSPYTDDYLLRRLSLVGSLFYILFYFAPYTKATPLFHTSPIRISIMAIGALLFLSIIAFYFTSMWRVFEKADRPGWAIFVPFYNLYTLLKVAKKPGWWLALFFIPFVNIFAAISVALSISKNFGKSDGFGLGLLFLGFIFYPILAFGDATYQPDSLPSRLDDLDISDHDELDPDREYDIEVEEWPILKDEI